jgi:hypothetical protein
MLSKLDNLPAGQAGQSDFMIMARRGRPGGTAPGTVAHFCGYQEETVVGYGYYSCLNNGKQLCQYDLPVFSLSSMKILVQPKDCKPAI